MVWGWGGETQTHTGGHRLGLLLQRGLRRWEGLDQKEGFVPSFPGLSSSDSPHPPARQSKDNFMELSFLINLILLGLRAESFPQIGHLWGWRRDRRARGMKCPHSSWEVKGFCVPSF